jgi:hypothetical protein
MAKATWNQRKNTVRENFLLTRLMEDWFDLLAEKERSLRS